MFADKGIREAKENIKFLYSTKIVLNKRQDEGQRNGEKRKLPN